MRLGAGIWLALIALVGVAQAMTAEDAGLLAHAAERGSASAQLMLGLAYLGGNQPAQCKLGKLLLADKAAGGDPEQARYWLQRAAAEGNAEAQYLLGRIYHEGKWVAQNSAKARSLIERSALQGYEMAVTFLHMLESLGYSTAEDFHHRPPDLRKLAEDGDPEAQYQYGMRLEHGSPASAKDVAAAITWYQRAAASGQRMAMASLAHIYRNGAAGVAANAALADEWARKSRAAAR